MKENISNNEEYRKIFEEYESNVRSYCRNFDNVFKTAKGSIIKAMDGKEYIDFFCGAGGLNYGHNHPYIKQKLVDYIMQDGIVHSLDMYTEAKAEFLDFFEKQILQKRGYDYKVQFVGPTGTNAVEAALKLARKVKKRPTIWSLIGAFHGMTLGSLALTSDEASRKGAGVPLHDVIHMPNEFTEGVDSIAYMEAILKDDHSGFEKPAAIIIETVQAEGGIFVFSKKWLQDLRTLCDKYDILLIIDDIQVGCARTGTFFSFERAEIIPDIVTLSKSIGGYGIPFALTLFKKELDIWNPGEHNGTFRGNQLAMVASKASLEILLNEHVEDMVKEREKMIKEFLEEIKKEHPNYAIRGIGCIWGIDVEDGDLSKKIVQSCFKKGLILERAGRKDSVVKIMPSLIIEEDLLRKGFSILKEAIEEVERG